MRGCNLRGRGVCCDHRDGGTGSTKERYRRDRLSGSWQRFDHEQVARRDRDGERG
jgi:hypothetical protein